MWLYGDQQLYMEYGQWRSLLNLHWPVCTVTVNCPSTRTLDGSLPALFTVWDINQKSVCPADWPSEPVKLWDIVLICDKGMEWRGEGVTWLPRSIRYSLVYHSIYCRNSIVYLKAKRKLSFISLLVGHSASLHSYVQRLVLYKGCTSTGENSDFISAHCCFI